MSYLADQIPTDVSAIYLDNTSIQVSFTVKDTIVNPYYYYHVVAYDLCENVYDTSGTTSPITLYGLTENTTYYYYVECIQFASTGITTLRTAQWPKIYVLYAYDISYNSANLYWLGIDFSSVQISRGSTDVSYIYTKNDYGTYYDDDLSGNTVYYYYITPYLTLNDVLKTGTTFGASSIITKVAPVTNLSASPSEDGSGILVFFNPGKNTYNYAYYTAYSEGTIDVSGTSSTLLLQDLSGNTAYSIYVITTLDNSFSLVSKSSTITSTTNVRAPYAYVSFYDNSAILVQASSKNTYNSITYTASIEGLEDVIRVSSPILIQNLSGNTSYTVSVSNTLNGNTELNATTTIDEKIITKVQPPTDITLYYLDNSAIGLSFTPGKNSYNSFIWTGTVTDNDGYIGSTVSNDIPLYITELSGNTQYTATVSTTLDGSGSLFATSTSSLIVTTNVSPSSNLILSFYDSSAITVSFTPGKNSYTSIYYTATAVSDGENVFSSNSMSPIQITELSGNTSYNIFVTTVVDSSLTAVSTSSIYAKTNVQFPSKSYIFYYDNSSITVSLGELPRNSYSNTLYYLANATDIQGNTFSSYTDGSLSPNKIIITDLSENTLYYVTVATIADDIYSDILNIGNVTTGIVLPYNIEASEIYTDVPAAASTVRLSFIETTYNGSEYYIATASAVDISCAPISASSISSPILLTGLSGNTTYTIGLKTIADGVEYISTSSATIRTAIQTPVDLEILSLVDTSFTVAFTKGRNTSTKSYYILRATDISSGEVIDVSSNSGILSMYGSEVLSDETYYDIDIITVVDNSMVSYGGLFNIYEKKVINYPSIQSFYLSEVSMNSIKLNWSGTDISYVSVSRRIGTLLPYVDICGSDYQSPYVDSDISGNTTYYYTITPYSIQYKKLYSGNTSSVVSATTPYSYISDLSAIFYDSSSVLLRFTEPKNSYYTNKYYYGRADYSGNVITSSQYNTSPILIQNLSSETTYSCYIMSYVDNLYISTSSSINVTTKSNAKPITPFTATGTYSTTTNIDYKSIITWTGAGTIVFGSNVDANVLIVGGGGSGGAARVGQPAGGGGGAGGVRVGIISFVANQTYTITVGSGGVTVTGRNGNPGSSSSIVGGSINEVALGGGGGQWGMGGYSTSMDGGSGGGGASTINTYGSALTSTGSLTVYGRNGGTGNAYGGGGGGGATSVGTTASTSMQGGTGGDGYTWPVTGVIYAAGGGGGGGSTSAQGTSGIGGSNGVGGRGGGTGGGATTPTAYGCGGGGVVSTTTGGTPPGSGSSGVIIIAFT